jgi:hypothetical protein
LHATALIQIPTLAIKTIMGVYKVDDPAELGRRLRDEMALRFPDVKAFAAAVAKTAGPVRGTSYPNIYAYVTGKAPDEPRPAIIEAMAKVLGVLPEYLVSDGPRTAAEQEARERIPSPRERKDVRWADEIDRIFLGAFPGMGPLIRKRRGPGAAAHAQLWRLWHQVHSTNLIYDSLDPDGPGTDEAVKPERWREMALASAHQVIRAVRAPLRELEIIPKSAAEENTGYDALVRAGLVYDRLDSYVIMACEALLPAHMPRERSGIKAVRKRQERGEK